MSKLTVALMGNQNCGKTTLFNALTGANQYVGNWPGVTVDRVVGKATDYDWNVIDLPGLYALSPYSPEEQVTRNYLIDSNYDVILNLVDGSHLDRSLSLTLELLSFNKPMVVAVNMIDVVEKEGIKLDLDKLSNLLGVEVVDISASDKKGFDDLKDAVNRAQKPKLRAIFNEEIKDAITKASALVENVKDQGSKEFIVQSLVQGDDVYLKTYENDNKLLDSVKDIQALVQAKTGFDPQAYFATARYQYIDSAIEQVRVANGESVFTKALDKVVLNNILALPIFLVVVGLVYFGAMYFTSYLELIPFDDEGEIAYATITDYVNDNIFGGYVTDFVSTLVEDANAPDWVQSLAVDGVVGGVGAVLGFLPQIAFLFFFLSILEQSGYMTRVAFVLDKIFRKFGLSGRNFIPLVIATGCGVPGLMAHNTIENINERRIGLITTTFIPCSAKLPIITMIFASVFDGAWWFAPLVYAISIFSIVASGIILKKQQAFNEEVSPFVLEIPDYRIPTVGNIFKTVYERCKAFVIKAGTIIFTVVVVVWFLATFGFGEEGFGMVDHVDNSILAAIGSVFAFIFVPVGFGSWQATVAVINGLLAKENVVGTLAVVLGLDGEYEGGEEDLSSAIVNYFAHLNDGQSSPVLVALIALSFLTFNLWSTPCAAALGAMKRQLGSTKWWLFAITYMTVWAYALALIIFRIGGFITGVLPFSIYTVFALIVLAILIYLLVKPDRKNKPNLVIPVKNV